ncbi:MAG: MarR family winged helix-turn-helix transcriptional regulator [Jatrophihabitantaceae bacterium]
MSTSENTHVAESDDGDDPTLAQAIIAIRTLMFAGQQFRHAVADHFDVGPSETVAINHLSMFGPLTPRQLADRVGLTPSSVTALLDRLEHAGLATRAAHPTDRRQSIITITEHGTTMQTQIQRWLRSALADLDQARLHETLTALTDLAAALGTQATRISKQTGHS